MPGKTSVIYWIFFSLALHLAGLSLCPAPEFFSPPFPEYLVVELFAGSISPAEGTSVADNSTRLEKTLQTSNDCSKEVSQKIPQTTLHKSPPVVKTAPSLAPPDIKKEAKITTAPQDAPGKNTTEIRSIPLANQTETSREDQAPSTGSVFKGSNNMSLNINEYGASPGENGTGSPVEVPLAYGDNPPPPYPGAARRRGWEGEVLLLVHVTASGKVSRVAVSQSSGYQILDRAAANSVYRWRFQAAMRNGREVPGQVMVPIRFSIKDTF